MERSVAAGIEHFLFEPEDTSLPEFTVLEFSGYEGISRLTHFDIKLLCPDQQVDFSKILGKRASLKIWCWQDSDYSRMYHGIISNFEHIGEDKNNAVFRAQLVPFLWRLTLYYQCAIFQEKAVPEILEDVLKEAGFESDDYRISLEGTYDTLNKPPREFCVQYRETDFNFISRLMEEEGIFYFFEYGDSKEVLVIADDPSIHTETSPLSELAYETPSGLQPLEEEFVYPLTYKESVLPSQFMLKDFNYETPQTNLLSTSQIDSSEYAYVYDYPGHFGFLDRGTTLTGIRNEESEAGRKTIVGGSNCRSFVAGYRFSLSGHPREDLEGDFLLTKVTHHGEQGGPLATDVQTSYENKFEAMSADVRYRPPRITPKARVQGTQTATVVGPPGEDLYMDEKGRAKVQFHWDLSGQSNENSSCWVRVSHGYAGQTHGIQFHPLIDDEVVVDFLEGDPDKPIIVGRVYNGDNMPPLKPEDRIQNIILTPYQHRILLDDKGAQIVINTGGRETITMSDGDEGKSSYGNNINISTADKHFMHLAQGTEAQGITIKTQNSNLIVLDDKNENIAAMTTGGHKLVMDDQNSKIAVTSSAGHSITIDDGGKKITVTDSTEMHKFEIDMGGSKLTISTDTGDIDLKAPIGKLTVKAREIDMNASMNMKLQAGLQLSSEAGLKHSTKAMTIDSKASLLNEITGALVKIN